MVPEQLISVLPYPTALIEAGSGRVLFANTEARRLLALDSIDSDPAGRPRVAASGGATLGADEYLLGRAAHGDEFRNRKVTYKTAEGQLSYLVSCVAAASEPGSSPLRLLTFKDVTQVESVERQLRDCLSNRDQFVSEASHELKQPLNSMLLTVEFLETLFATGGAPPLQQVQSELQVLRRQGQRLSRLIENLLDVARINNGKLHLDREPVDLCQVVREVAARFDGESRLTETPIRLELPPSAVGCFDQLRVEQVVSNLVSNAMKYGSHQPVTVRVVAGPQELVLQVEDRGIGIPPADRVRIFDRFQRAADAHRRHSLGLGLFIVRSIVEAHSGSIRLASEVGSGSVFTVSLPRQLDDCNAAAVA